MCYNVKVNQLALLIIIWLKHYVKTPIGATSRKDLSSGFPTRPTQTGLYNHRRLKFWFKEVEGLCYMYLCSKITKGLISCTAHTIVCQFYSHGNLPSPKANYKGSGAVLQNKRLNYGVFTYTINLLWTLLTAEEIRCVFDDI